MCRWPFVCRDASIAPSGAGRLVWHVRTVLLVSTDIDEDLQAGVLAALTGSACSSCTQMFPNAASATGCQSR